MARPAPKQSPAFFVIWFLSLGVMLWMMNSRPQDTRSTTQVFAELQKQNVETKDVSVASSLNTYTTLLDRDVKDKKLTEAVAQDKKIEAAILVANTQIRAGLMRKDTSRIRLGYQTLWSYQKSHLDKPEWKDKTYTTAPDSRFPELPAVTSGQNLFDKTSELLIERNKHELIWGFLPGGYAFIDFLINLTGKNPHFSYALGALMLAVVVRLIVFPFTQKTIMHSRQMSQLTPLMNEIKEKFKDDPQQMNVKVMELYREYGLNPAGGCVPAFIQMPLFLTVYQCMLLYQFEFQKGFFLWINPVTSKATNGFIAPNLGTQDAILIVVYGISMIISQMLTPISDPSQKKQMRLMGIGISVLFTFFMFTGAFPVVGGFVLYWTFTNVLATIQSLRAYRLPLPPIAKVNTNAGGVYPNDPSQLFPWMKGPAAKAKDALDPKDKNKPATNGKANFGGSTKTGKPTQHKPKKK